MDGDLVLLFGASRARSAIASPCADPMWRCARPSSFRGSDFRGTLRPAATLQSWAHRHIQFDRLGGRGLWPDCASGGKPVRCHGRRRDAAGGASLVFGLSMVGWFRDPARVVAMAGLGRWLIAGRRRLTQAPPAAVPVLLGALQGWLPCALVYAAASRASLAGTPVMGALTMLVFGTGNVACGFCDDPGSTDATAARAGAALGGRAVGRPGSTVDPARTRDFRIGAAGEMVVMSTTHAGVIRGLASRQCAHCRLPLPARPHRETDGAETLLFCCVGCVLVFRVIGNAGEGGRADWFLAKLGLAALLSGNIMMFQSLAYFGTLDTLGPEVVRTSSWIMFLLCACRVRAARHTDAQDRGAGIIPRSSYARDADRIRCAGGHRLFGLPNAARRPQSLL